MKKFRKTSLVFGFLIWTCFVAFVAFGTGWTSSHNRLLWQVLINSDELSTDLKSLTSEQDKMKVYLKYRKSCFLKTTGDKIAERE